MNPTTAQRFGSLGKSFVSPAVSAAVLGAALLASGTSDDAETAWSPAAACLLPDVLPVAGTLLSYGGNRQLAAGGTVTHSGALQLPGPGTGDGVILLGGANGPGLGGSAGGFWVTINASRTNPAMLVGLDRVNIPAASYLGFTSGNWSAAADVKFSRNATGPALLACADGGLQVRNLANSADALIACGGVKLNGSSTVNIERRADVDMLMFQGLNTVYGVGIGSSGFRPGLVIPRLSKIYFSNDTQAATDEIELVRASTSLFDVRCDNGMRVRNKLNSADAPIACGAITASGNVTSAQSNATVAATVTTTLDSGGTRPGLTISYPGFTGFCGWYSVGMQIGTFTQAPVRVVTNNVTRVTFADTSGAVTFTGPVSGITTLATTAAITSGGAIQDTPTQSSLNPTTTNIPSGKRQGWYNSTLAEFRDWVNIGGTLLKSASYT